MTRTSMVGVALLAMLIGVSACANTNDQVGTSVAAPSTSSSTSAGDAHNQADSMFTMQMIPHHRQAIEMADDLLGKRGIDPRVEDLAKQIKAAQSPEIEQMQSWLTTWGVPGQSVQPNMPDMGGMMSDADMTALRNAQGVLASKLFLTQMIQHHQGAITMAQNEIKTGQNPATVALAHSIVVGQQKEIGTMNQILPTL